MTLMSSWKKKSSNDAHGEISDLTQFSLVFYTFNDLFNGNCTQLVLALFLFLNFRFQGFFLTFWLVALHSHSCWSVGFLLFSCRDFFFFNLSVIILLLSFFCLSLHLLIFCLAVLLL